jgi:hypothetical protein
MLLQGARTSNLKEDKSKSHEQPQRTKSKRETKKANLTLDQQVICFAEIIVKQLLKDLNCL